jgi:hypothetical protein
MRLSILKKAVFFIRSLIKTQCLKRAWWFTQKSRSPSMWPLFCPSDVMQTTDKRIPCAAFVPGASADIGGALREHLLGNGRLAQAGSQPWRK